MRTAYVLAVIVGVAAWIGLAAPARGQIIIVDADQFPAGMNVSNAFSHVTLSAEAILQQPATNRVFSSAPPNGLITGSRVLAWDWDGVPLWNWNSVMLVARWDQTIAYAAIDFYCPTLGGDTVTVQAFDAVGALLESRDLFVELGAIGTVTLSRPAADIATIKAFGGAGPRMDNLRWSPTIQLPLRPCCFVNGGCLLTTGANCSAVGGASIGAGPSSCTPSPCQQAIGACCAAGGGCTVQMGTACTAAGRRFLGAGTACTTLNGTNSCCAADIDASGTVSVGDIFRFLTEWFAGCP